MGIKKSWGLPLGSSAQGAIYRYESNLAKQQIGTTFVDNKLLFSLQILKELVGKYKFNTDDERLLRIENKFFSTLFFEGYCGLYKHQNNINVFSVSNMEVDMFGNITKVKIQHTPDVFDFTPKTQDNGAKYLTLSTKEELDNFIFIKLDNTGYNFLLKYSPFVETYNFLLNAYLKNVKMKNKKFVIKKNNNVKNVYDAFIQSLEDESPFIEIQNPKVEGDMRDDIGLALQDAFNISFTKFNEGSVISIEEVIKYNKFMRDMLGFVANPSDKKERVITTEVAESQANTIQMDEVEMRNLKLFCKEVKTKYGIDLEIEKTFNSKIKTSKQAYNDYEGDEKW